MGDFLHLFGANRMFGQHARGQDALNQAFHHETIIVRENIRRQSDFRVVMPDAVGALLIRRVKTIFERQLPMRFLNRL